MTSAQHLNRRAREDHDGADLHRLVVVVALTGSLRLMHHLTTNMISVYDEEPAT
jgi:hypothetical protein